MTCFCSKESQQKRCVDTDYDSGFSCGQVCGDVMPCGEHTCSRPCHPFLCGSCEVPELVKCYCGNEMKEMKCSDKEDPKDSSRKYEISDHEYSDDDDFEEWTGYYVCGKVCNRFVYSSGSSIPWLLIYYSLDCLLAVFTTVRSHVTPRTSTTAIARRIRRSSRIVRVLKRP